MTEKKKRYPGAVYIETPVGIFTPAGNWFHTSGEAVEQFVPGLLNRKPLSELIRDAEVWIRSADNLSILLLLILLVTSGLVPAITVTAVFLPLWHIAKSGAFSRLITVFLRLIDIEIVLLLLAVGPLSWLGMEGFYYELLAGLAGFIILKFGLYRRFIDYLYELLNGGAIPLNDRLFRMVLVKHAMAFGIRTDEVAEMDKNIRELINKRKKL
ncbi:MAG: hypothetical protein ACNA8K_00175 [Cyclonatronaceae bacterium]